MHMINCSPKLPGPVSEHCSGGWANGVLWTIDVSCLHELSCPRVAFIR